MRFLLGILLSLLLVAAAHAAPVPVYVGAISHVGLIPHAAVPLPPLHAPVKLAINPHRMGLPVMLGIEGVADADEAPASPDVGAIVDAARAKDWEVMAAALLGLLAWAARRFAAPTHFFHEKAGAAVLSIGLAVIGALVPLLSSHANLMTCASTGGMALFSAVMALSNPSMAAKLALLCLGLVTVSGCSPAYAKNRAEYATDAKACAGKVSDSQVVEAADVVTDLVTNKQADAAAVGEQLGLSYGLPTALCLIEYLFTDFGGGPMAGERYEQALAYDLVVAYDVFVAYDGHSGAVLAPRSRDPRVLDVLRELRAHPEHVHGHKRHRKH
jgi:hypothetical protein